MILDEATSNLDAITERALDKTISEFSKDVTTIFIAHRLSTIKIAIRYMCWKMERL